MKWSNDSLIKYFQRGDTIFWFRRDLRLEDNAGLYHALRESKNVIGLFIFDTHILDDLNNKHDRRIHFIMESLMQLKSVLEEKGSTLVILYGKPEELFQNLEAKAVYTNHDFEPYATHRDEEVSKILKKKNTSFHSFKDHVIFEKGEVTKGDQSPYTIFTPYAQKWKAKLNKFFIRSYPTEKYAENLKKIDPCPSPSLKDIGFIETEQTFPPRVIRTSIIKHYDETRDFPAIAGTTRLSVHLRFGTVSIRKLVQVARKYNEVWLNELIWRDFYAMILWHFPNVQHHSFKSAYDRIHWRNNTEEFKRWCEGQTGYPIVDAGMRELNATGFMHNRVRMITASFLVKHLLIDWRWGEAYFAKKLLDYDLASNNGGWQWAAGSGCDAAPYFRVFNPELQTKKFDADFVYIREWVPEFETEQYVKPIVDHKFARERAMKIYKVALNA